MPPNIFVCLPAFGRQVCSETTAWLIHSVVALVNKQISFLFGTMSYPDIAELRNVMATIFFDTMPQCSHLWFVDADLRAEPNLITDFIAFDKPFVGAMYRLKDDPIAFVGNAMEGPPQIENGYIKRRDIGAGSILIRRDCFETILNKNPQLPDYRLDTHQMSGLLGQYGVKRIIRFFDKIETDHGIMSEDISFCKRVRDSGMDVWASMNHTTTHIGLKGFEGNFGQFMKSEQAKANG